MRNKPKAEDKVSLGLVVFAACLALLINITSNFLWEIASFSPMNFGQLGLGIFCMISSICLLCMAKKLAS